MSLQKIISEEYKTELSKLTRYSMQKRPSAEPATHFHYFFLAFYRMDGKRDSQLSHRSSTLSNDSWFPENDHQLVPPYMDMYSEAGYVEYEPEFNGPVPASKYQKPVTMTVETVPAYNGPPPRYGPPPGLGCKCCKLYLVRGDIS